MDQAMLDHISPETFLARQLPSLEVGLLALYGILETSRCALQKGNVAGPSYKERLSSRTVCRAVLGSGDRVFHPMGTPKGGSPGQAETRLYLLVQTQPLPWLATLRSCSLAHFPLLN